MSKFSKGQRVWIPSMGRSGRIADITSGPQGDGYVVEYERVPGMKWTTESKWFPEDMIQEITH